MKQNIALKIRIYPNITQIKLLNKNFGCARYVYNELLSLYNKTNKVSSYKDIYNDDNTWLKDADTSLYANVVIHLKRAINNHYSNSKKFGLPTYKSKRSKKQSYTTSVTNNNSRVIDNKHIRIPKVGILKAKVHRNMPNDYKLKSVTISKEADDKYYASLLYEYYEKSCEKQTDKNFTFMLGIDYSMAHLGVLSNGEYIDYPQFMKKNMHRLADLERALSRCTPKSNNWYKRQNDIARLYAKIKNQRKDFLNKKSLELATRYDVIVIEDLDLQEMSKDNHYGACIYDNSYNMFTNKLNYKLTKIGKQLIKIGKYFPSSKKCSVCGNINKELKISDRTYTCNCGNHIDRDYNVAINIVSQGYKMLNEVKINI